MLELRGRHQYSDQRSNRNRAPCVASNAVGIKGEEGQMARLSAQREQLTEEGREAGKSLTKREKSTGPRTDPCEHLDKLKKNDFCDFEKPHKHAYQKGKIELNQQSKKGSQPK